MIEKVINVPDWSEVLKKVEILGKRAENCCIFIDDELIPKNLLVKSKKTEGVYYLKQEEYQMELYNNSEENYWVLGYLFKENGSILYLINYFNEDEIYFFIKKNSTT